MRAPLFVLVLVVGACSLAGGTLGGREKCWSSSETRIASLMKGYLALDPAGSALNTPEGERLSLYFATMSVSPASGGDVLLDRNRATAASDGELVTLWGGLGADESMLVCAVEERHPA